MVDEQDFKVSLLPMLIAVGVGGAGALIMPSPPVQGTMVIALSLVVLNALAEQLFFTGLVLRTLAGLVKDGVAVLLSACNYGVYQLTFHALVATTPLQDLPVELATIALCVGLPCALLYVSTRSMVPPLICQLILNGMVVVLALTSSTVP